MHWVIGILAALGLALAPVLLGMPGFLIFAAGCLFLVVPVFRRDAPQRKGRLATLVGAFVLLFLLYYLPALVHEF